jgi:hypothetical protein
MLLRRSGGRMRSAGQAALAEEIRIRTIFQQRNMKVIGHEADISVDGSVT